MKSRISYLMILIIALVTGLLVPIQAQETTEYGPPNGTLVIVGGGSMNGTGIIEHNVFLSGAVPGKTYYFQLQGSTADGRLFQSELDTFTVPEPGALALQLLALSALYGLRRARRRV